MPDFNVCHTLIPDAFLSSPQFPSSSAALVFAKPNLHLPRCCSFAYFVILVKPLNTKMTSAPP